MTESPRCLRCHKEYETASLTFEAQGTGTCNKCARVRIMLAETKPEAKLWIQTWRAKMLSCLALKGSYR